MGSNGYYQSPSTWTLADNSGTITSANGGVSTGTVLTNFANVSDNSFRSLDDEPIYSQTMCINASDIKFN